MNFRQAYRMNTPTVVAEVFEQEVVIIHLESGTYYSLDQSGTMIWKLLQQGATVAEIIDKMGASYGLAADALGKPVQQLIEELCTENLIVADNTTTLRHQPLDALSMGSSTVKAQHSFVPPHLHKYTDMQDLLLLDPIHDVTETGWPHVAER